jgi:shikimate kinase
MTEQKRIVLTGFMGVGKSTVAKCLGQLLRQRSYDLDRYIEAQEQSTIPTIIAERGIEGFREIESKHLARLLGLSDAYVISLGGGAWVSEQNRVLIREHGFTTVWLEAGFEHCWRNISCSRHARPLVKDRAATEKLFEERQRSYSLADWHFIVKPELTLYEIAKQIADEVIY